MEEEEEEEGSRRGNRGERRGKGGRVGVAAPLTSFLCCHLGRKIFSLQSFVDMWTRSFVAG